VHGTVQLSDSDIKTPKLGIDNKVYAGIAEGIKPDTLIQKELFDYTYRMLEKGITQVYGNLEYNDKQFEFTQRLKRNAARFAGYKSAWQTAQLKSAKPEAYAKINKAYNNLWMRSEYVHTVRSARTAQNYRKYLEDADIYPYLEYMPSKSAEPRADHKKLYGIIKPIEDSFWDTYMPPIDWGCKCSVAQRRRDTGSAELPDDAPKSPAAMRNNPGKKGELFTDGHPMIKKLSNEKRQEIDKYVVSEIAKPILIKEYKDGGKYFENALINKGANDYKDLSIVADSFANQGYKAEILPNLHNSDIFYKYLFEGAYPNKNPDLKINGNFYEFESWDKKTEWNKNKISNMLKKGLKQSDRIIIDVSKGYYTENYIHKIAMDMIDSGTKISEVWILDNNKIIKIL
jgi:hypothetical protein